MVDGDVEVLPGVSVIRTGGHSKGHQAIVIRGTSRDRSAFFGDLGMRPWSANPRWVTSFDDFPLDSVEVKGELFARAAEEGWLDRAQPRAGDPDRPPDARSRPVPLRPGLTSGARLTAMFRMAVGHSDDIDLEAALADRLRSSASEPSRARRRRPGS